MNTIDEIKRLKLLLDNGAITNEEFQLLKSKVISNGSINSITDTKIDEQTQIDAPVKKPLYKSKGKRNYVIPIIISSIIILIVAYFIIINGEDNIIKRKIQIISREYNVLSGKINKLQDIDGNKYNTIQIGEQTWMAENLNVSKFRNGDPIAEAKTGEEWVQAGLDNRAAWCYYNNDPSNGKKYGKLYNWHAVNDPRGLAPEGWETASSIDWSGLISFLGGVDVASEKLKSVRDWEDKLGNNSSGFSAPPSGIRDYYPDNNFYGLNIRGVWWTRDVYNEIRAIQISLTNNSYSMDKDIKGKGFSVRCIKDSNWENKNKSLVEKERIKEEQSVISDDGERLGVLIKKECTFSNNNNGIVLSIPEGKMWTPIYYEYTDCQRCSQIIAPIIFTERSGKKNWSRDSGFDFPEKDDFISYKVCKRNRKAIGEREICIGLEDVSCESIKYILYFIEE